MTWEKWAPDGAGITAQQVNKLSVTPESHTSASPCTGCSTSDPAANGLEKVAEEGSGAWLPVTHVGEALGFTLAHPQ